MERPHMEWYEVEVVTLPAGVRGKVQRTGINNGVRVRLESDEAGILVETTLTEERQAELRLVTDEMLVDWLWQQHDAWLERQREGASHAVEEGQQP